MFWPSFNGALVAPGQDQQRAVINTYLSLVACCVTTFAVSGLLSDDRPRKLSMVRKTNFLAGVPLTLVLYFLLNKNNDW